MIFSAIGAAVAGIGGLLSSTMLAGGIGSLLLKAAVGIGLNLAAQALAGKPEGPSFAIQGQLQSGGDVPRAFPLGYTATAGSLVYANTWGSEKKTPNAYLTQVIALSDLPINSLVGLWVNGEKVTIDWNDTSYGSRGYPVKEYWTGPGGNHMWVKFYDGTQTAADSFLVNTVSSAERPYQSTRVGYGVAYAVVTTQINEELFTGFPQFKFEVYGLKLYDVTKDSTAGGSGTHRWSDPSTWGGDGDHLPAVQLYNLWRGLSYGGKWLYGLQGVTTARLPAAHWRAQIQKCRAVIKSGGANVATYRSGAEIAVSAPLGDASEALLTSCQGRMSEAGGVYKVFVGAPGLPVASFTDGEIISTEEQSFTPFFGLADSINGIAGKHPNPAEAWNVKVAPPIYRADLEAKDGNRRLMADVSFDFVPYADQVQRLMKSALEEAQRARRHTFVLPPEYWILEAG
ncbi:putative tail protein, partial [Pseudaminobacter salicylatoxidans]